MSEYLLQIPTIAIISWIAWRISFVEKRLERVEERNTAIEKILNIPVQALVGEIKKGNLTLTEKAKNQSQEELNSLSADSLIFSTKKREEQSL